MTPRWAPLFVLFLLPPSLARAQDDAAAAEAARRAAEIARQQYETQRNEAQQRAIRDKSIADLNAFLNSTPPSRTVVPSAAQELQTRFFEFRQAIAKFQVATADYRREVGMAGKLNKPLKDLETQADVMLRYLSLARMKHPPADPAEFKDYKPTELVWETLNAAERISTFLPLAVEVEKQDVIAPAMLEFMYKLNGELLRLKWLTAHTKG